MFDGKRRRTVQLKVEHGSRVRTQGEATGRSQVRPTSSSPYQTMAPNAALILQMQSKFGNRATASWLTMQRKSASQQVVQRVTVKHFDILTRFNAKNFGMTEQEFQQRYDLYQPAAPSLQALEVLIRNPPDAVDWAQLVNAGKEAIALYVQNPNQDIQKLLQSAQKKQCFQRGRADDIEWLIANNHLTLTHDGEFLMEGGEYQGNNHIRYKLTRTDTGMESKWVIHGHWRNGARLQAAHIKPVANEKGNDRRDILHNAQLTARLGRWR